MEGVAPRGLGSEWLVSGDGWFRVSLDSVALGRLSADAVGGVMLDPLPKGLSKVFPSVSRVFASILVCISRSSEGRFLEQVV